MRIGVAAIAAGVMVAGATLVGAPAQAKTVADGVKVTVDPGGAFSTKYRTWVTVSDRVLDGWAATVTARKGGKTVELRQGWQRSTMLTTGKWRGRVSVSLPQSLPADEWLQSECEFTNVGPADWTPYVEPQYEILPHRLRTVTGTVTCSDVVLGRTVTYSGPASYTQRQYYSTTNEGWIPTPLSDESWKSSGLTRQSAEARVDREFTFRVRQRNSTYVSVSEAYAIRLGMTLREVTRIIGDRGTQAVKSAGGVQVRQYEYDSDSKPPLTLTFIRGRVTSISR